MDLTTLKKDGHIDLPEEVRLDLEVGTVFEVKRGKKAILLKRIRLTPKEEEEQRELEEIWKDIDEGNCKSYSVEEFFESMKKW